ncbi:Expansin [Parasponia andersonii]|uniref:Expansin n=1 Tax=Parasponia andersonii TaxID=3476 RepID=A0A2P5B3B3_PARAD|nr:Expansin [Parasponia andersonii]
MEKRLYVLSRLLLFVGVFTSKLRATSAGRLQAHATFYGGSDATGTMGEGGSGYGNLYTDGYGTKTAALSTALFSRLCLMMGNPAVVATRLCDASRVPQWCLKGTSITITATNFCPPNYTLPSDNGSWCNPPHPHFDLSQPAFQTIAKYKAGITPIFYRKVGCKRSGGIRFTVNERDYFELVLISNVGIAGDISNFWIKGSKTNKWEAMARNWGANWHSLSYLNGQTLSFRLQTTNGKTRTALNIVPSTWRFGQSFTTNLQF